MGRGRAGGVARARAAAASSPTPARERRAAQEPERFGPSQATTRFAPGMDATEKAGLEARLRTMFGRDLTKQEIASMVGAPDNATVTISHGWAHGTVQVGIESPQMSATRTLRLHGGDVKIHNDIFIAHQTGTGLGIKVFGRQVEQAAKLGVKSIDTNAARAEGLYNGYYTWARFGYDAAIPPTVHSQLPSGMRSARKISDLMQTESGRAFWKEHGKSTDMKFDLTPGSQSRQTLNAYLRGKGL